MSDFSFFYPKRSLDSALARRGFVARRGRCPVATDVEIGTFSEERNIVCFSSSFECSGAVYVPCLDRRNGVFFASTETLASSSRPRSLYLELARGQLSRILKKRADWAGLGLRTPASLRAAIRREIPRFAALATADSDASGFDAESVATFERLREISLRFNDFFLEQSASARQNAVCGWTTNFGFSTSGTFDLRGKDGRGDRTRRWGLESAFETANPTISWADVEKNEGTYDWTVFDRAVKNALKRGFLTTIGPLFRWERRSTPRWLLGRPNEAEATVAAFRRFVDAILERDAGRTSRWIVAMNVEKDDFGPPSETRFELAEETALKIARRFPDAEAFLGFDQPFGDAARFRRCASVSPLEFAAKIARRRSFDGFFLELNFGLSKRATAPRDPIEWHLFFDRWASLGARLSIAASYPSASPELVVSNRAASESESRLARWFGGGKKTSGKRVARASALLTEAPENVLQEEFWSEKTQQENARRFYLTVLGRRSIDEVIWTRLEDGLVDGRDPFDDEASDTTAFDLSPPKTVEPPPFVLRGDDETEELLADNSTNETAVSNKFRRDGVEGTSDVPFEPFPTSGLIGVDGKPKPAFHRLASLRRAYLDS